MQQRQPAGGESGTVIKAYELCSCERLSTLVVQELCNCGSRQALIVLRVMSQGVFDATAVSM